MEVSSVFKKSTPDLVASAQHCLGHRLGDGHELGPLAYAICVTLRVRQYCKKHVLPFMVLPALERLC